MIFLKMNILLILSASSTFGASQNYLRPRNYQYPPPIPIVSASNELNPDGSFSYSYVSGDGSQAQAQGYLKNAGHKEKESEVIKGSYSYTAPDGTPITVNWIADENGFRAEGSHLPTPPPVPSSFEQYEDFYNIVVMISKKRKFQINQHLMVLKSCWVMGESRLLCSTTDDYEE